MAQTNPYISVIVESFRPDHTSGLHGSIHIRPVPGQKYPPTLRVECSKKLSRNYPVGTRFRIMAKLTDREGEGAFLYSYFGWEYEVLGPAPAL